MSYDPVKVIAIRNYQSLESVTLALGRITVIIGHTDSGKTAFMRACEQASFNDTGYSALTIKNGVPAAKCQVAWTVGEKTVVWERTATTARYFVIDPAEPKPRMFEKLGRGYIPDDIHQIMGFIQVTPDPNAASMRPQFVGQFDLPFLVGDRGGVASARLLSRLTGLHVLSFAQKKLYSTKTDFAAKLRTHQERLEKIETDLATYTDVDKREEELLDLQIRLTEVRYSVEQVARGKQLRDMLNKVTQERAHWQQTLKVIDLTTSKQALQNCSARLHKLRALTAARNNLTNIKIEKARLEARLADIPTVRHLESQIRSLGAKLLLSRKIARITEEKRTARQTVVTAVQSREEALAARARFEQVHPLCPFTAEFPNQQGFFRCKHLMVQIGKKS